MRVFGAGLESALVALASLLLLLFLLLVIPAKAGMTSKNYDKANSEGNKREQEHDRWRR
jgi:hypothetical protein